MMLSLLMLLASDPVAATTVTQDDLRTRLAAIHQTQARCRSGGVIQTESRTQRPTVEPQPPAASRLGTTDLMFRSGDPVQMTLLLERSVDQCSIPISTELSGPGSALPRFGHGN